MERIYTKSGTSSYMDGMGLKSESTPIGRWCERNYARLRESLSLQGLFDEDAYQDAYMEAFKEKGFDVEPADFEQEVRTAYRKFWKQHLNEGFVFVRPDELLFTLLPDEEPEQDDEARKKPYFSQMVKEIKAYVKHNYTPTLFLVWEKGRLNGLSYVDISAFTGMATTKVKGSIANIDADIREHFMVSYKRRLRRTVL